MYNFWTTSKKQHIKITNFWSISIFSTENNVTWIRWVRNYLEQKKQIFKGKKFWYQSNLSYPEKNEKTLRNTLSHRMHLCFLDHLEKKKTSDGITAKDLSLETIWENYLKAINMNSNFCTKSKWAYSAMVELYEERELANIFFRLSPSKDCLIN